MSFNLFRYAKKVEGLSNQEKAALIAIADAQGDVDGECYASVATMAKDYGRTVRSLQRGIHGYKKKTKDGEPRVVVEGLVKRKLIYALGSTAGGSHSNTTHWRIDVDVLIQYLPPKWADKIREALGRVTPRVTSTGDTVSPVRVTSEKVTGDKRAVDGCHSAGQPPNTAPPEQITSNQPSPKTAAGWLAKTYGQMKGEPLPGGTGARNQNLVAEAMTLAPGRVMEFWKRWLDQRDLTGMKFPLSMFVNELPGLIGADTSSEREYTKEELDAIRAQVAQQLAQEKADLDHRLAAEKQAEEYALANVDKWL